ncbi:MAG TPA: hypothetical protein VFA90_20070 [Terriglobales bacterium]|nr:hypothetical protein [Terriglobales bacterium]
MASFKFVGPVISDPEVKTVISRAPRHGFDAQKVVTRTSILGGLQIRLGKVGGMNSQIRSEFLRITSDLKRIVLETLAL